MKEAGKYIWDAKNAADKIARFTLASRFEDYSANDMMRAAVERQFEIIGEAFVNYAVSMQTLQRPSQNYRRPSPSATSWPMAMQPSMISWSGTSFKPT